MTISPLAGKPPPTEMLIDPARLEREYFERRPDLDDPQQLVSFGTSGHRSSPLRVSFTEAHTLCRHPGHLRLPGCPGHRWPTLYGQGSHAVSGPAQPHRARSSGGQRGADDHSARRRIYTVISRAILVYNRSRTQHLAEGIVITPSPDPPANGGFRYHPPNRGPADTDVTQLVENQVNELLRNGNTGVKRVGFTTHSTLTRRTRKISSCPTSMTCAIVDMEAIRAAGLELAVDPLGGANMHYWEPNNAVYTLNAGSIRPLAPLSGRSAPVSAVRALCHRVGPQAAGPESLYRSASPRASSGASSSTRRFSSRST